MKSEFLVMAIMKTFKGKEVLNYPGKGKKESDFLPVSLEGLQPVNPLPLGRIERENKNEDKTKCS